MLRVPVKPELLHWAVERARHDAGALEKRFPRLDTWLSGKVNPTFKQLEDFAKATYTPIGYFFLPEPPIETVPIPDLRTMGSRAIERPSPNMLDTIYLCQQRQDWYRQHAMLMGEQPLKFVGSVTPSADVVRSASDIRSTLGLESAMLAEAPDLQGAIRVILDRADAAGVLVMLNGVVGNNTHRVLDTGEFRGFALSDPLAPLIFVNAADTKSAQMFTLGHELAHLWLGESGVSDVTTASTPRADIERWCNAVAAEFLVPLAEFKEALRPNAELWGEVRRLSARFRVSSLVVLRRMRDARRLTRDEHEAAFEQESARLRALMLSRKADGKGGGDFYLTANYRLGARFATAVVTSAWEGRATFTEAFRLLNCRSVKTLHNLGSSLGLANPTDWGGETG